MSKLRLDDAQSVFFARQLEQIETKLYEVKYADLEAEMLLPNRIQVDPGVDKYTFYTFDKRGAAVPFAGNEDGAPLVDVDGQKDEAPMMSWVDAYGYNFEEIRAAAKANLPLVDMRAQAARRALAQAINNMALVGNTVGGMKGLFNLSNTLTASVATGVGGFLWTQKTADEILIDLFVMADTMANSTIDIENPTVMVLPKASVRLLSSKRLTGTASDRTVLEYFQAQRPGLKIVAANKLTTAGTGGGQRAVIYNPAMVSWLVSTPFEQLPVEQHGFRFLINCHARGGGVITPYPKSVLYVDGF